MQFRLVHTEVPFLHFEKLESVGGGDVKEDRLEEAYKLKLNVFPDANRQEMFAVMFQAELTHHQEFKIELHYVAWFECLEPFKKEELNSPFVLVNAPAIAFPFLRSFVSLLTLNSGFRPAILPTVNFVKMYEESKEGKQLKTL